MRILVTVGTTKFPSLIKAIKTISEENCLRSHYITVQHADSRLIYEDTPNIKYYKFIEGLNDLYYGYDLIISHAGAGTIYKLLDLNKNIIVVPNYDRKDHHQKDLADFVKSNNYGLVLSDPAFLSGEIINEALHGSYNLFKKEKFFLTEHIFN